MRKNQGGFIFAVLAVVLGFTAAVVGIEKTYHGDSTESVSARTAQK